MSRRDKPITIGPRYTLLGGTPWTLPNVGQSIDNMAAAYQHYINRTDLFEGRAAIKDFRSACAEFISGSAIFYDYLYSHLEIAAPPIDRGLRARIDASVTWDVFHARWLTFMQLCQHFSAREELTALDRKVAKIELLYEMRRMAQELLELAELPALVPREVEHEQG